VQNDGEFARDGDFGFAEPVALALDFCLVHGLALIKINSPPCRLIYVKAAFCARL
jgi:hypothetical protein